MVRWVTLALALGVASVATASDSDLMYDFEWRVTASVSRLERGQLRTVRGERKGTAHLVLRVQPDGVLEFEWEGAEGTGSGLIGPGGPEHVTFPLPEEVGIPPAPPYRGAARFTFDGARERPTSFEITWVEVFYCRTAPRACENVTAWERGFAGIARRVRRDTRL